MDKGILDESPLSSGDMPKPTTGAGILGLYRAVRMMCFILCIHTHVSVMKFNLQFKHGKKHLKTQTVKQLMQCSVCALRMKFMKMWATCINTIVYEHKHYGSVVADLIAELVTKWLVCG